MKKFLIILVVLALILVAVVAFRQAGEKPDPNPGVSADQPTGQPTEEPDVTPGTEPTDGPASEPGTEPPASEPVEEPTDEPGGDSAPPVVRFAVLSGPTGVGAAKLLNDADKGAALNAYDYLIATENSELVAALTKGEVDIATVASNVALNLYNKTNGGVQVLAINNLGVLYVLEKGDSVNSIADLKGKTIYSTGKGTTPEYSLNYILKQNGLDPEKDLTVEYKSEATEVAAILAQEESAIAMLPQPFVTSVMLNTDGLRVVFDMTVEWDFIQQQIGGSSALVTGVIVARTDFINENPKAVAQFLEEYKASSEYTASNLEDCAALVEQYGIVAKAAIAEKAIPYCNIAYFDGTEMKDKVSGYLSALYEQNPESVGGTLPGDDFYYGA